MSIVGAPLNRVDGKAKVTGAAKYSAEFQIPNLAYAVLIESTIPSGSVVDIDADEAGRVKGVLDIDAGQRAQTTEAATAPFSLAGQQGALQ